MEYPEQKLPSLPRYVILQWQLLLANVRIELFVVLTFEREAATQQSIQENAECPYVCWRSGILNLTHDFWSHVRWRSAEYLDLLVVRDAC